MRHSLLAALALACLPLTSCGTLNTVRWVYGMPSVFAKPDAFSEGAALRAVAAPVVLPAAVVFDVATLPVQAIFGVWPYWGDASLHMNPNK